MSAWIFAASLRFSSDENINEQKEETPPGGVRAFTEKNVPVKYVATGILAESTGNIFKATGSLFEIIGILFET